VTGVEELDLPGGDLGGERAVPPVRVLFKLGLLTRFAWGAAGNRLQAGGPSVQMVPPALSR
jgi:hypothetical protein